jgi:uncharacterized membrane protein
MDKKTFNYVRIFTAMIIAAVCSVSVTLGNYILPLVVGVTSAVVIYAMKKQVKGVLADERDYQVAGKAARWTLYFYTVAAAVSSLVLMAVRGNGSGYELAAQIFAYSACALLITQSLLFKIFSRTSND